MRHGVLVCKTPYRRAAAPNVLFGGILLPAYRPDGTNNVGRTDLFAPSEMFVK